MKNLVNPMKSLFVTLFLVVCFLSLTACNRPILQPGAGSVGNLAEAPVSTGVTIVSPADGAQLQVGEFVDIQSQIGDPSGVTAAVLTVNDEPLRRDQLVSPVADGDLYQPWTPDAPGTYVLQVILETGAGGQVVSNQVTVYVGGKEDEPVEEENGQCAAEELVAPVLISPANGATVEPDPVLEWSYPDTDCHPYAYQIDISEDPSFADLSLGFGTLDHNETSRMWPLPAGRCYHWRASAYVPDENGPPSPAWSFCVEGSTGTPTSTGTPMPTATPTDTPTPDDPMATGLQNSNCRKGPDTRYDVQGYLMEGETVPIVGRNNDSSWWVVELQDPLKECWVWGGGVSTSGNMADLVVIKPPPPPTFTPTPTNTPKPPTDTPKPPTDTPKGPSYSACHDYPDMNTCNSDPEGFGNCTWDTGMNKCQP